MVEAQTVDSPNTSAAVTPAPIDEPDDATVTEPISYETLIVSPAEAATIPMGPVIFGPMQSSPGSLRVSALS